MSSANSFFRSRSVCTTLRPFERPPARRQSVDVSVDRKGRLAEGLRHHHARRLVSDAGQRLEILQRVRDLAVELVHEDLREPVNGLRLLWCESAGLDGRVNCRDRKPLHHVGRGGHCEQAGRHLVDAFIGALRRQEHRHEQRIRIAVVQGDLRLADELVEDERDTIGLVCALHAAQCRAFSLAEAWQLVQALEVLGIRLASAQFKSALGHRFGGDVHSAVGDVDQLPVRLSVVGRIDHQGRIASA